MAASRPRSLEDDLARTNKTCSSRWRKDTRLVRYIALQKIGGQHRNGLAGLHEVTPRHIKLLAASTSLHLAFLYPLPFVLSWQHCFFYSSLLRTFLYNIWFTLAWKLQAFARLPRGLLRKLISNFCSLTSTSVKTRFFSRVGGIYRKHWWCNSILIGFWLLASRSLELEQRS